jgi:oligopeptidase B
MTVQQPPDVSPRPHQLSLHGHTRVDPYYWLREKSNPDVIAYIDAENAYTEATMAGSVHLQEQLYQEYVGRIQQTDQTYPVKRGTYGYYQRTVENQQYPIYCRHALDSPDSEEVLLDLNALASGHDFYKLGLFEVSPDQRLLAYSDDAVGSEHFELKFKDLESGELLPDRISNTTYSGSWANDSQTFYYTTQDQAKRPYRLHRHRLGQDAGDDTLLFEEDDATFGVYLSKTRDACFIRFTSGSSETREVHLIDAGDPEAELAVVQPRMPGVRYSVEHREGVLYIVTNFEARNFRVMQTSVANLGLPHWSEFLPYDDQVMISDLDAFADHLVIYQRRGGRRTIEVVDMASGEREPIAFPDEVYTYGISTNPEYDTSLLRINYSSLISPNTVYEYDMAAHALLLRKREPVLGGFDSSDYITEWLTATSPDGTGVPISIAYRRSLKRDGENPCFLYGYGSYGASMDPAFRGEWISLLDRGFVVAIAHIRGGQELGRQWYEAGKYLNKINTFTDFIACGRHLISEGYTQAERLAIYGRSAGGLLIGAVLNMAPDLCKTAVAGVPFVDVVTTMLDETIPLTSGEFEEWGNPQDPAYYDYLLSYSPYDNLVSGNYPNLLVTAGLNDSRVQYWEPLKWVAKLRDLKTDSNKLVLETNTGAGHSGASGRYDFLREQAFIYGFVLDTLGLE